MSQNIRESAVLAIPFIAGMQADLARLRSEARLKEVRRAERIEKLLDRTSDRSGLPN